MGNAGLRLARGCWGPPGAAREAAGVRVGAAPLPFASRAGRVFPARLPLPCTRVHARMCARMRLCPPTPCGVPAPGSCCPSHRWLSHCPSVPSPPPLSSWALAGLRLPQPAAACAGSRMAQLATARHGPRPREVVLVPVPGAAGVTQRLRAAAGTGGRAAAWGATRVCKVSHVPAHVWCAQGMHMRSGQGTGAPCTVLLRLTCPTACLSPVGLRGREGRACTRDARAQAACTRERRCVHEGCACTSSARAREALRAQGMHKCSVGCAQPCSRCVHTSVHERAWRHGRVGVQAGARAALPDSLLSHRSRQRPDGERARLFLHGGLPEQQPGLGGTQPPRRPHRLPPGAGFPRAPLRHVPDLVLALPRR